MTALILSALLTPLLLLVIGLLAFQWWRLRGQGGVTVLQEFRVSADPNAEQVIYVRGRRSGISGWLFNLLGIEADTVFRVSQFDLTREGSSLSGFRSEYVPLRHVGLVACGYHRAAEFLILSLVLLAAGLLSFLVAWLTTGGQPYERQQAYRLAVRTILGNSVLATAFYLLYVLSKHIYVTVASASDKIRVSFKRSIVENVTVDLDKAFQLVEVLNNRVLNAKQPQGGEEPPHDHELRVAHPTP